MYDFWEREAIAAGEIPAARFLAKVGPGICPDTMRPYAEMDAERERQAAQQAAELEQLEDLQAWRDTILGVGNDG